MISTNGKNRCAATYALLGLIAFGGCDFDVTNYGVVDDDNLNSPTIHAEMLRGAEMQQGWALVTMAIRSAIVSRELTLSGIVMQGTQIVELAHGRLDPIETITSWTRGHEARFLAEHALERMRTTDDFASYVPAAKAALFAGYANRLLGEHMCYSVFDGGPALSHEEHLRRAEDYFTEAYQIATAAGDAKLRHAALAGRASVLIWSNDPQSWAAAVQDAQQVPIDFVRFQPYNDHNANQYNWFFEGNRNQPFRDNSVWNTFYESYYAEYGDPRTRWEIVAGAEFGTIAEIPWYPPRKYDSRKSSIRIASGQEMQLIIAEAKLRDAGWQEALEMINAVRSDVGMAPWQASNLEEAWTALKLERGIELWLEGRRLPDLRRWTAQNAPGQMEDMTGRTLCSPIVTTELETNPNL
jgi:starch-binding outer membrane protein, SusD/RagB family